MKLLLKAMCVQRVVVGLSLLMVSQVSLYAAVLPMPFHRPATLSPLASRVAVSALALAGKRIVAVGERGIIQLSDDSGKTWRQVPAPVSVTLTAVHFPTPKLGWAVGHAGIILHTADAGETWTLQLDGTAVAAAALKQAAAMGAQPESAGTAALLAQARQLVEDGPDKPFLDVYFTSDRDGIAVGAYGLIFGTRDGGRTWMPLMPRLANPKGMHLYAIRGTPDMLVIAGEQGFVAKSADGGNSFTSVQTPYVGTYFATAVLPGGVVLLGGMKGNLYRATGMDGVFHRAASTSMPSLNTLFPLPDGRVIAANQGGQILVSTDLGNSFAVTRGAPAGGPLSAVLQAPDGALIGAGLRGLVRLPQAVLSVQRK